MNASPDGMQIIDNIQPADENHADDWFPYGSVLVVTTSDPDNTQFLDSEIKDAQGNLVEIAQVDPEFDKKHQMIHLKIQTAFEDLEGQELTLKVAWADASDEEYSYTATFKCV